jgi:hypothetical protein
MAHAANDDDLLGIVYVIQEAIIPHPQPKTTVRAPKSLHPMRPWLVREGTDTGIDSGEHVQGQCPQIPLGCWSDRQPIGH